MLTTSSSFISFLALKPIRYAFDRQKMVCISMNEANRKKRKKRNSVECKVPTFTCKAFAIRLQLSIGSLSSASSTIWNMS